MRRWEDFRHRCRGLEPHFAVRPTTDTEVGHKRISIVQQYRTFLDSVAHRLHLIEVGTVDRKIGVEDSNARPVDHRRDPAPGRGGAAASRAAGAGNPARYARVPEPGWDSCPTAG